MSIWKCVSDIRTGVSHKETGRVCQDSLKLETIENGIIAALADGVGMFQRAEVASQAATEATVQWLKDHWAQLTDENVRERILEEMLPYVQAAVRKAADEAQVAQNRLDCNLAFVCVFTDSDWALIGQLGDCALCLLGQEPRLVTDLSTAFGTATVLYERAAQVMTLEMVDLNADRVHSIMLTSDGLAGCIYQKSSRFALKQAEVFVNLTCDQEEEAAQALVTQTLDALVQQHGDILDDDISFVMLTRATEKVTLPADPTWLCGCGARNKIYSNYCKDCNKEFLDVYKNLDIGDYKTLDAFFAFYNRDEALEQELLRQYCKPVVAPEEDPKPVRTPVLPVLVESFANQTVSPRDMAAINKARAAKDQTTPQEKTTTDRKGFANVQATPIRLEDMQAQAKVYTEVKQAQANGPTDPNGIPEVKTSPKQEPAAQSDAQETTKKTNTIHIKDGVLRGGVRGIDLTPHPMAGPEPVSVDPQEPVEVTFSRSNAQYMQSQDNSPDAVQDQSEETSNSRRQKNKFSTREKGGDQQPPTHTGLRSCLFVGAGAFLVIMAMLALVWTCFRSCSTANKPSDGNSWVAYGDGSYKGEMKNGVPDGQGILLEGGYFWSGTFRDGVKHGEFTIVNETDMTDNQTKVFENGIEVQETATQPAEETVWGLCVVKETVTLREEPGFNGKYATEKIRSGQTVEMLLQMPTVIEHTQWMKIRTQGDFVGWCDMANLDLDAEVTTSTESAEEDIWMSCEVMATITLRKEPGFIGQYTDVKIQQGDTVYFMEHEMTTLEETVWVRLKTEDGFVGWCDTANLDLAPELFDDMDT